MDDPQPSSSSMPSLWGSPSPWNPLDSDTNLQMNAQNAMNQSQNPDVKKILSTVAVVAVFAVVLIGGAMKIQQSMQGEVKANLDLRHGLLAKIDRIDPSRDSFTVTMTTTQDTALMATGTKSWTVLLPPGVKFDTWGSDLQVCYYVPNVTQSILNAQPVACSGILFPNRSVVVDYLTLQQDGKMVARKIYGQIK